MKAYTDIKQSKKLAEILPLKSADMCYIQDLLAGGKYGEYKPYIGDLIPAYGQGKIRGWSLAALLRVLPYPELREQYNGNWTCKVSNAERTYLWEDDSPVDACVAMVEKLHEQKLL